MDTYFAPAGRDDPISLERRVGIVRRTEFVQAMLDAIPVPAIVMNGCRQILAVNESLRRLLEANPDEIIGRRPGEVMGCAYWHEGPDGCGTSKHCLTCGAVSAILDSQRYPERAVRECRMSLDDALDGGALDLRVTASRLDIAEEHFTICILEDTSREKRLNVLSRVFFHDVLNTAGGIQGYVRLLEDALHEDPESVRKLEQLGRLADQLVGEIEGQRELTLAESGDLVIHLEAVETTALLQGLRTLYLGHDVAVRRHIVLENVWDGRLVTDARLLSRVLGNMLKNALEATKAGGTVTLGCSHDQGYVDFTVHNPSCMPDEVKLQIFHRSFSTKAATGRGIGTYSMRLLGEHYLGGTVSFNSTEQDGTCFTLRVPRLLPPPVSKPNAKSGFN
jgi:signal transduction histidine kinase